MSPKTYNSPLFSILPPSRSAAVAQVEDRNKAKGLTESSYNKMVGDKEDENLSPQMKQIMDFRRAIALQEAENELEVEKRFAPRKRQLAREAEEEEIGYSQFRQRSPMVGTKYGMADFRGIGSGSGFGSGNFGSV